MERVMIIGPSAAGKSELARHISKAYRLPLIHMDREFFLPGWIRPKQEDWYQKVALLVQEDHWVMEGNYFDTIECRLARADTLIALDLPRRIYMFRLLLRMIAMHGIYRDDIGLLDRFNVRHLWKTWQFPTTGRPLLLSAIAQAQHRKLTLFVFSNKADIRLYIQNLASSI